MVDGSWAISEDELDDEFLDRFFSKKRKYPVPYPGNIKPTQKPDYSMFILYEVLRGRNVNYSFRRMVKMMADIEKVEDIVRSFMEKEELYPESPGYLNLANVVSEHFGLNYTYEPTETGNLIRVWGRNKEEFAFDMRRGEHRIRGEPHRDYSKLLKVRKVDMLSYRKVLKTDKSLIKPFLFKRRMGE